MSKMVECPECGQLFMARTCGKYCPDCRDAANKAKKKEADKRRWDKRKADKKAEMVDIMDCPERIQLCLNCTKKNCSGDCKEVRRIKNEVKESDDD